MRIRSLRRDRALLCSATAAATSPWRADPQRSPGSCDADQAFQFLVCHGRLWFPCTGGACSLPFEGAGAGTGTCAFFPMPLERGADRRNAGRRPARPTESRVHSNRDSMDDPNWKVDMGQTVSTKTALAGSVRAAQASTRRRQVGMVFVPVRVPAPRIPSRSRQAQGGDGVRGPCCSLGAG